MHCRTKIVLTWALAAISASIYAVSDELQGIAFAPLALIPLIRRSANEINYWQGVVSTNGKVMLGALAWMLGWLLYILIGYFRSSPVGAFTMGTSQWIAFFSPLCLIFLFYESHWFRACSKVEQEA